MTTHEFDARHAGVTLILPTDGDGQISTDHMEPGDRIVNLPSGVVTLIGINSGDLCTITDEQGDVYIGHVNDSGEPLPCDRFGWVWITLD